MLIQYKKKIFISNLVFVLLCISLFLLTIDLEEKVRHLDYFYLFLELAYIGLYFYNKIKKSLKCLSLKNILIWMNYLE